MCPPYWNFNWVMSYYCIMVKLLGKSVHSIFTFMRGKVEIDLLEHSMGTTKNFPHDICISSIFARSFVGSWMKGYIQNYLFSFPNNCPPTTRNIIREQKSSCQFFCPFVGGSFLSWIPLRWLKESWEFWTKSFTAGISNLTSHILNVWLKNYRMLLKFGGKMVKFQRGGFVWLVFID